jgi:hypothetical protein
LTPKGLIHNNTYKQIYKKMKKQEQEQGLVKRVRFSQQAVIAQNYYPPVSKGELSARKRESDRETERLEKEIFAKNQLVLRYNQPGSSAAKEGVGGVGSQGGCAPWEDEWGTGGLPSNIAKSIAPGNLRRRPDGSASRDIMNVEEKMKEELRENRNKCMLFRLLSDNGPGADDLLNKYARLARMCATTYGIYPLGKTTMDAEVKILEIRMAEEGYATMLASPVKMPKRAFLLHSLYVCPEFLQLFCPQQPGRKFLCNPEKLTKFLFSTNSLFTRLYARFIFQTEPHALYGDAFSQFVGGALHEWMKMRPWVDMDFWHTAPAMQPSIEIKLLLNQPLDHDLRGKFDDTQYLLANTSAGNPEADDAYQHQQHQQQLTYDD